MTATASPALPSLETLAARLSAAIADGTHSGDVLILGRERSPYTSSFPSEVITCRDADGRVRRFFCKYSAESVQNAHGHRGGVAYEAEVYRLIIQPSRVSAPRFYGVYSDPSNDRDWMVVEFLENSHWIDKSTDPNAMNRAATWLAHFHALNEWRVHERSKLPLRVYDAAYYQGWASRTRQYSERWKEEYPWLDGFCARFDRVFALLLSAPQTVIHGEFYPMNVLYSSGTVYPVDWESAAIGPGEIDLATLTEDWPNRVAQQCEARYRQVRWPDEPRADFERTLQAARVYLLFRWLGDRPEWTSNEAARQSIDRLHDLGEQMGLLESS